jgi:NAD dependent epimerase/dehydratase family enzyme
MRIAVTGSTGLIGSALVSDLRTAGHSVSRLVRNSRTESPTERLISWNPERGVVDSVALEGHDAIVHLAGDQEC